MTGAGGRPAGRLGDPSREQGFVDAVQTAFADATQTIFYGMAIAMALAFVVALLRLPGGKPPEAEVIE
jgi:hypothetical protein